VNATQAAVEMVDEDREPTTHYVVTSNPVS